jgi:anti-sigma factor RsiW
MKPFDPQSLNHALSAFVDGELDAAATERLLRQLSSDPAAVEALRRFQQLTIAGRRAIRGRTPPPSDALIERLRAITATTSRPDREERPARQRAAMRAFWYVLPRVAAALVLLVVGVWFGHHSSRRGGVDPRSGPDATAVEVIPASMIAQAEEVHGFCSRLADGLHTAGYPVELAPLASSVQLDLHGEHPYPDLAPIGYRYRGAGPCGVPLGDTVHLLYRAARPGSVKAISIFVQPWRAQFPLAEGRLYTVSVATSPFPMLAWRTDRVVYFLVADDAATLQRAATLIRGTPTSGPTVNK